MPNRKSSSDLEQLRAHRQAARRLSPGIHVSDQPLTEDELYAQLVTRRSKVVCVGGYTGPMHDPSAALLTRLVRSKNVTLVDAQDGIYQEIMDSLSSRKRLLRHTLPVYPAPKDVPRAQNHIRRIEEILYLDKKNMGIGGNIRYRAALKDYKRVLPPLPSSLRLKVALAWDLGFKPNSMDLIVDRGTWWYTRDQHPLQSTLTHYLETLRPGGRLVLFGLPGRAQRDLEPHLDELNLNHMVRIDHVELKNAPSRTPALLGIRSYQYPTAYVITKLARSPSNNSP